MIAFLQKLIAENGLYLTIGVSAFLILLAIISSMINPFFRNGFLKRIDLKNVGEGEEGNGEEGNPSTGMQKRGEGISIIIPAHDDAEELDKHLPLLLSQQYDGDYQVIVVAEQGDSDTEDVLKRVGNNPHLYTTFIPNSSRYMSRRKLSITLGVKAAPYEWIILTDAFSSPQSDEWLRNMARNFTPETNLVIGYSGYALDARDYERFERLRTSYYLLREAVIGTAYRTNGTNLAFRKSEFMGNNGYLGNLDLIRGEFDFLVNKYARKGHTAVELAPNAWVRDDAPSDKTWMNKMIYYRETRRHLQRSFPHRCLCHVDMLMMHVNYLVALFALVLSIVLKGWIITGASSLALLLTMTLRSAFARKAIQQFGEEVPTAKIIPFEISMTWRNLFIWIRYKCVNKYDFTTHKQ